MCGCCRKWVHAEFNVCDKPAHQGRQMCSKGTVVIECALCFLESVAKVLPEPADEEPAGGRCLEHWLGYDSTGLKDEPLPEGQALYYSGNHAGILAAREDAKPAPTAATVEAARQMGAGRAGTVSQDAVAAADIVCVQELTQVELTGQAGVQAGWNGNGKPCGRGRVGVVRAA